MELPAGRVEQLLADYDRALAGSLLAAHSRRAYRSRVAGYLAWLATTDYPGDPLADPHTRNHAARDYRTWLTTRQRRRPATANAALTALDHFYSPSASARPPPARRPARRRPPGAERGRAARLPARRGEGTLLEPHRSR